MLFLCRFELYSRWVPPEDGTTEGTRIDVSSIGQIGEPLVLH